MRFAAASILAALAVLVALLAADVRAWPAALRSGDAAAGRAGWRPDTRLGGLSASLVGVKDDLALREALQRYRASAALPHRLDNALARQSARAAAENALAGVARDGSAVQASQALTLLGILGFNGISRGGGESQVDEAAQDFSDAVRFDPANALAKFDLELLLRLTAAHGVRIGAGQGSGFGKSGRHGAGAGVPGTGY